MLRNLPRLTPAPGTKPTAVTVSGSWDAELGKARLTWKAPASTNNLEKLQVRACTGQYNADDEEVIADLPLSATHYETDWDLALPGAIASFKVYVMATNGNENADKAVKITHPAV